MERQQTRLKNIQKDTPDKKTNLTKSRNSKSVKPIYALVGLINILLLVWLQKEKIKK